MRSAPSQLLPGQHSEAGPITAQIPEGEVVEEMVEEACDVQMGIMVRK